ncbi:class I SAM-dependent methyltransferase [Kitasatospora sp. NPDC004531]
MTSPFDTLPAAYDDFSATPFRTFLETPSVLRALGDLRGTAVLDLGCGSGYYTRLLRRNGAARVTGADVSAGMVAHARAEEAARPLGVDYLLGALPEPRAGTFDLVLAVYVLPYATTRAELGRLCATAARALRPGGRFVTLPLHPAVRPHAVSYERYGFRLSSAVPPADVPPVDGSAVVLNLHADPQPVTARYWSREALELALRDAGFGSPRWTELAVTAPGVAAHGAAYWQGYLAHPHTVIVDCRKRRTTGGPG